MNSERFSHDQLLFCNVDHFGAHINIYCNITKSELEYYKWYISIDKVNDIGFILMRDNKIATQNNNGGCNLYRYRNENDDCLYATFNLSQLEKVCELFELGNTHMTEPMKREMDFNDIQTEKLYLSNMSFFECDCGDCIRALLFHFPEFYEGYKLIVNHKDSFPKLNKDVFFNKEVFDQLMNECVSINASCTTSRATLYDATRMYIYIPNIGTVDFGVGCHLDCVIVRGSMGGHFMFSQFIKECDYKRNDLINKATQNIIEHVDHRSSNKEKVRKYIPFSKKRQIYSKPELKLK